MLSGSGYECAHCEQTTVFVTAGLTKLEEEILRKRDPLTYCYKDHIDGEIPDISDDKDPPPKGTSIFFHETSCGRLDLLITPREACAVASTARLHPDRMVYLLLSAPSRYPGPHRNSTRAYKILQELLRYKNVRIRRCNIDKYVIDTPLENWDVHSKLQSSWFPFSHASDILRYLTLWKYGGTYLDLDVVVMKSLNDLGYNFVGMEDSSNFGAGVINFDSDSYGHLIANSCLSEIRNNFRGHKWLANGPRIISKVLQRVCKKKPARMIQQGCEGFQVLASSAFYPVPWEDWPAYFDPLKLKTTNTKLVNAYTIHVWNALSNNQVPKYREHPTVYGSVVKKFCPNIYENSGYIF